VKQRLLLLPLVAALAAGCGSGTGRELVPGASSSRGKKLIEKYGCGGCHMIPGIPGADARVGPPLDEFRRHRYIAGEIPNSPRNAMRWIENPQKIEPGTIMPNLGVKPDEARDIVGYLYSHT
jgi:cytochrome c